MRCAEVVVLSHRVVVVGNFLRLATGDSLSDGHTGRRSAVQGDRCIPRDSPCVVGLHDWWRHREVGDGRGSEASRELSRFRSPTTLVRWGANFTLDTCRKPWRVRGDSPNEPWPSRRELNAMYEIVR